MVALCIIGNMVEDRDMTPNDLICSNEAPLPTSCPFSIPRRTLPVDPWVFRENSRPSTIKQVLGLLALLCSSHLPAHPPRMEGKDTCEMCLIAHFTLTVSSLVSWSLKQSQAVPRKPETVYLHNF